LSSTLAAPLQSNGTVVVIQSADAPHWPALGNYRAVLWTDAVNGPWELVTIVSGQGSASLGVQRAAEAFNGVQSAIGWPSGTSIAAVVTHDGLDSRLYVSMRVDEFVPVAAATQVTLSRTPEQVVMVARNGVIQSQGAGHYSVAGSVLTFTASFSGTERVIVSYSVRGP
jgi:hypothetical protein